MTTMPDKPGPGAGRSFGERPSIKPKYLAALDELDARLSERDIRLRLYARRGMTVAMAHCEGDTEAAIGGALADGNAVLDDRAAVIAEQRGLPENWIAGLSGLPEPTEHERRPILVARIRLTGACARTANIPGAERLRKRAALVGMRLGVLLIMAMRKRPAERHRRRIHRTRSGGCSAGG